MIVYRGIYLFFDSEFSDDDELSHPHWDDLHWASNAPQSALAISFYNKLMQEIRDEFMRWDSKPYKDDEQGAGSSELKLLSEREFKQCCEKIKTVWFIPVDSFFGLEDELAGSAEITDVLRDAVSNHGVLFGFEWRDGTAFWTGTSIRRWFNASFPAEPEEVTYHEPPTVLDLLYEFLESASNNQESLLALKETISELPKEDRFFIQNILRGKNPGNSKEVEETSTRILRALKNREA